MSELTMDRLRENLESLKMKNTLEILDNYLERAVAENLNIVEVLDHIFSEEAKSKRIPVFWRVSGRDPVRQHETGGRETAAETGGQYPKPPV